MVFVFFLLPPASQSPDEELQIPVTIKGAEALWYFRGREQPNSQGKHHHAMIKGQARNTEIKHSVEEGGRDDSWKATRSKVMMA